MIFFRPKKLSDYKPFVALQSYDAVKVPGGEVAWADYDALRRDFPFLAMLDESDIDTWIVENFSYMSATQLELGELRNTKIPTDGTSATVYRQTNFGSEYQEFQGRGDIMEVRDPSTGEVVGLIDRKGVGVSKQKLKENHKILADLKAAGNEKGIETRNLSSGLAYLGEALIEAASIKVTQRVFDLLNATRDFDKPFPKAKLFDDAPLQTIDGYFVLVLPFQLLAGKFNAQPAAIYARQPHVGRVWTGKVYTQRVNIKQADFFLGLCDGGTVRIRLPELLETSQKIKGGPVLLQYEVGVDLVERFLKGEKKVLQTTIDEVLAPIEDRLAAITVPMPAPINGPVEAVEALLEVLEADAVRFYRFSEALWFLMKNDPVLGAKYRDRIAGLCRQYLAVGEDVIDQDGSKKPLRRFGLLLLSALPADEGRRALEIESRRWFNEPEFLARGAILFPFGELRGALSRLYWVAGGWLRSEVASLLGEEAKLSDPRRADWISLDRWLKARRGWAPRPVPLNKQEQIRKSYWISAARSIAFLRS